MQELVSSASYEPRLLSLLFAFAPAAMSIVIAYAIVMRGSPVLRGWLLGHFLCLVPYAIAVTLSPSLTSPAAAEQLFRFAAAFIPMAVATGAGFQLALVGKLRRARWLVWGFVGNAAVWIVITLSSDATVDGVESLPRLWFAHAGPYAWVALVNAIAMSGYPFAVLGWAALTMKPSDERRQLRQALAANLITYAGLFDAAIAYGIGSFPLGWLLLGIGSLLVVRALVVENLLRVRAVDASAPLLIAHFAAGILLGWLALNQLGPQLEWWGVAVVLALCFAGVRVSIAVIGLVNRGARTGEGPLDRLIGQLVGRSRAMTASTEIAQLAIDIVELGLGTRPGVLLASVEDWGWTTAGGERLSDEAAPDPLLGTWLAEQRGSVFADELEEVPADLHELLTPLFERQHARILVPIRSHDELLGLIVVPASARRIRGRSLAFLERLAERLAESLLHARMAQRAGERARLAREVELAATVQAELLPSAAPQQHPGVTIVGSWHPATRCAGDFWTASALPDGRLFVAIGDVTGHGVASAMVTAAAVGACDVAVRRHGDKLELTDLTLALDAAVRRVGGGELSMTCFASILDPKAGEIRFVSCGHTAPYLCRAKSSDIELHALVGRGNPLGAGIITVPKVVQRPLQAGDIVVWYTDGVIEAQDPAGEPFGDRRLQRVLRRLDHQRLTPSAVHDIVQAGVAAHRAGSPLADDETLVVAQLEGAQ